MELIGVRSPTKSLSDLDPPYGEKCGLTATLARLYALVVFFAKPDTLNLPEYDPVPLIYRVALGQKIG